MKKKKDKRTKGVSKRTASAAECANWLHLMPAEVRDALQQRKQAQALELIERALAKSPDDVLLICSLPIVQHHFRDYTSCIESGKRALALLGAYDPAQPEAQRCHSLLPELYNCIGMSFYNRGDLTAAERALRKAISSEPTNQEYYLNLATILRRKGDEGGAMRVITEGINTATRTDELAKMQVTPAREVTVSLCMIVKNEEQFLAGCLKSVKDLVDEIVIVDTGSEDNTVAIAEQFGAKVYHHPWENDFSRHRNQSLSYATGDWVLILDADEELAREDIPKLRQAMQSSAFNIISVSVHNKHLRTGEITSFLPSVRLWRRRLNLHYEGIVHNELRLPASEPVLRVDACIIHYGYGLDWDKMKEKIARSKALLYKQLEENHNNAFANFNLSQLLRGEHKTLPEEVCRQILKHSGTAVTHSDPNNISQRHIHLMALDQMVSALFYLREYQEAESTARRALALEPDYLDPLFSLGHIFAAQRDFPRAIKAYEDFIAAADRYSPGEETDNLIIQHLNDQPAAYFALGLIYEALRQDAEAERHFRKVLEYRDDHADIYTHLAFLCYRGRRAVEAREWALKRINRDPQDQTAQTLLAQMAAESGDLTEARRRYEGILANNPTNLPVLERLLAVLRADGQAEAVEQRASTLLTIDPNNASALIAKADLLFGEGAFDKAAAIYERLRSAGAPHPEVLTGLANCFFKLGEWSDAARLYVEALAVDPQSPVALRNLGVTYLKLGDRIAAISKLTNYLDYAENDFDILYLVARLSFEQGDFGTAIRYAERCLNLEPTSAELVAFVSDSYLKLGFVKSAQLGYRKALELDPEYEPAAEMLKQVRQFLSQQTEPVTIGTEGEK